MTQPLSNVYADTAYDSRKPRDLPPEPERNEGFLMRTARGQRIHLPVGPQCREYKGFSIHAQDEALEPVNIEKYDRENRGPHRMQSWPDLLEWAVFRRSIQYVVGFFTFAGAVPAIVFFTFLGGITAGLTTLAHFFIPLLSVWLFLRHLNKGEPKLKKDTRFYRRTGMVSLYLGKDQPRQELPFDEFDPYMSLRTGPTGSTSFVLQLAHRYSETLIGHPNQFNHIHGVYSAWEELQQFMDISEPLPDTMVNEPFRPYDPVTAEYDRKTNRQPDYWRTFNWRDISAYAVVVSDAAKDYPWGQTRDQALAQGWKPSIERWQEQQQAKKQAEANEVR